MKFLVIFALALATVSAFDLRNAKLKPEKEGRITNGQNAENGQFPYQVDVYPSYVGDNAIATGWGHTFDGSGPTGDLQWASLRVIDNSVCAEAYEEEFPSSQICVSGEDGISACDGDSGGPLVLADTNTQIGVMSFSTDSCTGGNPQSFTRITSYLPWISSNTGIVL
ncbi:hypothetical protein DOY81_009879 [Sarcophaga bullata]|nr:hypothetical protein DOY81_009879 [Sarcophaga bullata]